MLDIRQVKRGCGKCFDIDPEYLALKNTAKHLWNKDTMTIDLVNLSRDGKRLIIFESETLASVFRFGNRTGMKLHEIPYIENGKFYTAKQA